MSSDAQRRVSKPRVAGFHGLDTPPEAATRPARARIWWEIAIVLSLGLGQAAVYAIVSLADSLTKPTPLSQQTATLNPSLSNREIFDFIYQFLAIFFDLAPVALVCYLLWSTGKPHLSRLGIDAARPVGDGIRGLLLALIVGAGGIAVYLAGHALGIGVAVNPTGLDPHWWTIPVLLFSALRAGLQEEVVVLGYLFERLGEVGWGRWRIIVGTALLRGSYHLYQGFGAFVGNFLMGMLFGFLFSRPDSTGRRRVLPYVIAHFLIDAAIFVGYPWAASAFPHLLGLPGR